MTKKQSRELFCCWQGCLLWAKSAGGATANEWGYGITSLPNDATIVSGWFAGSVTFGAGEANARIAERRNQFYFIRDSFYEFIPSLSFFISRFPVKIEGDH